MDDSLKFKWNGVSCEEYGIVMLSAPKQITATERVNSITIPGRSGTLTQLEGEDIYDNIALGCTCLINNADRVHDISGWMRGSGKIEFPTTPEGYYVGRVSNQISFDQLVRGNPHRSFQLQFKCEPFLYLHDGLSTLTAVNGTPLRINNPGNISALPLLKVYGTGEGSIVCDGKTMTVNDFSNVDYILIDLEAKTVYKDNPMTLLGTRVSGDWLRIPTGVSFIILSGGITKVEITPRWRDRGI